MSRIYFHSEHGEAELRGSERGWLAWIASGPARTYWDIDRTGGLERAKAIIDLIPDTGSELGAGQYLKPMLAAAIVEEGRNKQLWDAHKAREAEGTARARSWPDTGYSALHTLNDGLRTALRAFGFPLVVAGVPLHTGDIELNTALVLGSPILALAAKLHGWCESFCWVEGPNRKWLADLIDEGLSAGIYRRGIWYEAKPDTAREWSSQGWENCTGLLRSRDDGPMVLSYSVCEQFPDVAISPSWPQWPAGTPERWDALTTEQQEERERIRDEFDDLPADQQWALAMEGLRAQRPWAQLAPETLINQRFHLGISIFDLFAPDRDDRVRAAATGAQEEAAP